MRFLFLLGLIAIAGLLVKARWQRLRRRWRGEPEPIQQGPSALTLLIIALLVVYCLMLGYQLFAGSWTSLH